MATRATVNADSLNAVGLFAGLPHAERTAIAARLGAHRHPAGHTIVSQADDNNEVFFILSGTVRVTFHAETGKDVQFRDLQAGEMFGELSAIDGRPRSAEVVALSEVFLATAPAETFLEVVTAHPAIARRLFVRLAALIRSLSDRVVEFSTLGVVNRIHGELLRLAREHGVVDNAARVAPAPTHADIAARVSTRREAVSREIAGLARRGIVRSRRGVLDILDVARLEDLVTRVAGE